MGMKPVGGLEERKLVTVLFADLAPEARGKVLAEIRHMLESVNDILRGVATNDLVAVEKVARAAGTEVAVEMEPAMMRQLLPAFRELGLQTHRSTRTASSASCSPSSRGTCRSTSGTASRSPSMGTSPTEAALLVHAAETPPHHAILVTIDDPPRPP
jgi:hypothetical protein